MCKYMYEELCVYVVVFASPYNAIQSLIQIFGWNAVCSLSDCSFVRITLTSFQPSTIQQYIYTKRTVHRARRLASPIRSNDILDVKLSVCNFFICLCLLSFALFNCSLHRCFYCWYTVSIATPKIQRNVLKSFLSFIKLLLFLENVLNISKTKVDRFCVCVY